ncbi:MAG: Asp-tRNA(Asn)/Glu-tRNA(Gln) amidotransferase subunit GatC [Breznakia sp.]
MSEFNKAYFKKLANQIMFDLSDEEIIALQEDFTLLRKQITLLDTIDTENVETMVYPFECATTYIREDVASNVITQTAALQNAPQQEKGQMIVPKVVK